MSTLVVAFNSSGPADAEDKLGMEYAIDQENVRRAALVPPLPPLQYNTAALRKSSYETSISTRAAALHLANIEAAKNSVASTTAFKDFRKAYATATPAQRTASLTALTT